MAKEQTPLMVAAENGHLELVFYLIGKGANKNLKRIVSKIKIIINPFQKGKTALDMCKRRKE